MGSAQSPFVASRIRVCRFALWSLLIVANFLCITASDTWCYAADAGRRAEASSELVPRAGVPRSPDVSSSQIVFLYGGELWVVDRGGGVATSVTKDGGPKSSPKFSPD